MTAEPMLDRHNLTFAQAEGVEPLPGPLQLKELSKVLRNRLWYCLYSPIENNSQRSGTRPSVIVGEWQGYLRELHVMYFNDPVDEFSISFDRWVDRLKQIVFNGSYAQVLGLFQALIRMQGPWKKFVGDVDLCMRQCKAAYVLVDGKTFFPVAGDQEREAVVGALDALARSEYGGARAHLVRAGELYNAGDNAGSVREAIHAVEAVARTMEPTATTLGPALTKLEKTGKLHPALKAAFSSLYGYTSDEEGVRHALVEKNAPAVDPAEALFMIGACASFVTYLIGKGQAAGILK